MRGAMSKSLCPTIITTRKRKTGNGMRFYGEFAGKLADQQFHCTKNVNGKNKPWVAGNTRNKKYPRRQLHDAWTS